MADSESGNNCAFYRPLALTIAGIGAFGLVFAGVLEWYTWRGSLDTRVDLMGRALAALPPSALPSAVQANTVLLRSIEGRIIVLEQHHKDRARGQ